MGNIQATQLRSPIAVEERVAVTIWKLATNVEYRTLSALFGLGRSTVCTVVVETCHAIATHLLPQYVKIPQGNKLREIVDGFETCWGFPQAAGAIDSSHIPIIRPDECASDYYNRKGYYSIIVQAMVDFCGLFMDVCIGWPGKVHDARVFVNSTLYQRGRSETLFPSWKRAISGVQVISYGCNITLYIMIYILQVPLVVLGDPAYPSLPWLMKPYLENEHTSRGEKLFNYRQSRARMVVENAFGRLKGRWRCLFKRLDVKLKNVTSVVAACLVLHNMCEMYGDFCLDEWTERSSDSDSHSTLPHAGVTPDAIGVRGRGRGTVNQHTARLDD